MIILGLTGSIAMGKSTVARQFKACRAAICDSDNIVHKLMGRNGEAVEKVRKLFPESIKNNAVDRKVLGEIVFGNEIKLKQLEAILHPLVRKYQDKFIKRAVIQRKKVVILDIPLLFETHAEKRCDYTVTVSAPVFMQRQRALTRQGMTKERLASILARQMPDSKKRIMADFIVFTGTGKYCSLRMVKGIMCKIRSPR